MLTYYYMLFRFRVRTRFSFWLVSGYAHLFILLSIVIVTLASIICGITVLVCW